MSDPRSSPAVSKWAALRAWATPERLRRAGVWSLVGSAGLAALLVGYVMVLIPLTPSVEEVRQAQVAQGSVLLSEDGIVLADFERAQQEPVPLAKISPHVVDALIATEDHRFYEHHGIDLRRTARRGAAHAARRPAGRLDHHPAAGAQPVPRGDRPRAQRSTARSRKRSPR